MIQNRLLTVRGALCKFGWNMRTTCSNWNWESKAHLWGWEVAVPPSIYCCNMKYFTLLLISPPAVSVCHLYMNKMTWAELHLAFHATREVMPLRTSMQKRSALCNLAWNKTVSMFQLSAKVPRCPALIQTQLTSWMGFTELVHLSEDV